MMNKMHWVNPEFVAQIKFAEWTRDGKFAHPCSSVCARTRSPETLSANSIARLYK